MRSTGTADILIHLFGISHTDAIIVRLILIGRDHPCGAWAERAIGKGFYAADAQHVIAKAPAQSHLYYVIEKLYRDILHDSQRQITTLMQYLVSTEGIRAIKIMNTCQPTAMRALYCDANLISNFRR